MSINPFLEERLPVGVAMGSEYADEYAVEISTTAGGNEHRRLIHPFPTRHFTIAYTMETSEYWDQILAIYHRAYGMFAGFRVKCLDDFTTNDRTAAPTAFDQTLTSLSAGVYQLRKEYGDGASPITIGPPERTIFKPVAGTVHVGVGSTEYLSGWTVDNTTGLVTFAADETLTITGITKAANAVITLDNPGSPSAHGFTIGESVYISGVIGMTQINAQRVQVVSAGPDTITINLNTGAYANYVSGGAVHTQPQAGELVSGGCEFDIPCRFNSRVGATIEAVAVLDSGSIDIVELLNP